MTQEIATRPVAEKAVTEGIEEALQRKVEGLKIDGDQWRLTASWAGGQATIATEEYGRSGFYLVGFWSGRLQVIIRRPWPLRDKRFIQKTKGRPWDFDAIADTIIEISAENVKHYAERESQATADAERDRLAREMRGDGVSVSASHGFPPGGDPACYSVSAGFLTESRALAVADVIRKVLTTIAILLLLAVPAAGQEDLTVTAGDGFHPAMLEVPPVWHAKISAAGEERIREISREIAREEIASCTPAQPQAPLTEDWVALAFSVLFLTLVCWLLYWMERCPKCGATTLAPSWDYLTDGPGEHLARRCQCGAILRRPCNDNGGKK